MKSFLFLCLICLGELNADIVHLTDAQKEKANQIITECIKETGVSPEILAEARKGTFHDDENLKKFTHCFFHKAGILTEDSKLNVDVAVAKLPPGVDKAEATKVLEECKSKTGKDPVDTAFEIFKCYNKGISTHILY